MADEALMQAGPAQASGFKTGSFSSPGPSDGSHLTPQDAALLEEIHAERTPPSRDFVVTPAGRVEGQASASTSRLILVLGVIAAVLLAAIALTALHAPFIPVLGVLLVVGGGLAALKFVHRKSPAVVETEVGTTETGDAVVAEPSVAPEGNVPEGNVPEGPIDPRASFAATTSEEPRQLLARSDAALEPPTASPLARSDAALEPPTASSLVRSDAAFGASTPLLAGTVGASDTQSVASVISSSETPTTVESPSAAVSAPCASSDSATCPDGHPVKPSHKFCGTCGSPLAATGV